MFRPLQRPITPAAAAAGDKLEGASSAISIYKIGRFGDAVAPGAFLSLRMLMDAAGSTFNPV